MLKNILVLLHVITAAGWFGVGLLLGSVSRKAVEHGGDALHAVGTRAVGMMSTFAVLTLVLGLSALFAGGGFAAYGPQYHTSITLVLILVLVQFFMIRPGWNSLVAGGGGSARSKIAIGTGIGHLLWLIVLVLMFWNHYPVGG